MIGRRGWIEGAGRIALALALPCTARAQAGGSGAMAVRAVLGQPAPAFELADSADRIRRLAEFKGRPVVLEWTSPSCPFAAAQYESGRLPALQKWSARRGVVWLAVLSSHPSRSDYLEPAAAEAFNRGRGAVAAALLMDPSGDVGRAYGAVTANHMFVIDRRGTLVYAGGVDDAMSTKADEVRVARNFVRAALDDVMAGRKVRETSAEPAGCAISYAG